MFYKLKKLLKKWQNRKKKQTINHTFTFNLDLEGLCRQETLRMGLVHFYSDGHVEVVSPGKTTIFTYTEKWKIKYKRKK